MASAPLYGDAIGVISANVSPTPLYLGDPTFEWFVPGGQLTNGSVSGSDTWLIAPGGLSPPATFTWTGNSLDQDLSSGGQADGTFLGDGTMSITGQLWDMSPFPQLLYDGLLLAADVSAFRWTESAPDSDFMNLVGTSMITPTGGYLLTSGGMNLVGDYYLDATVTQAEQNGGPLQDFQGDIVAVSSLQFVLVQVPEPGTGALVCGAVLLSLVSRRKGGLAIRRSEA